MAEALGFLPLALAQAAAYIEETGSGFDGYLRLLKTRPAKTLKLRANSSDAERAIATVWDIAFERVAASSPAALELLNLFAFLPPDRIPRSLLVEHADRLPSGIKATIEDPLNLSSAIGALRRYSLLETAGDAYAVHRLVQAVVRARLEDDAYRVFSEAAKDVEAGLVSTDGEEPLAATPRRKNLPAIGALIVIVGLAVAIIAKVSWPRLHDRLFPASPPRTVLSENLPPGRQPPTSPPIPKATHDWGIDFDGIESTRTIPAYSWGAVGPRYYVQTAGDTYAVYDKQGNPLIPLTSFNALWKSYPGLCATGDLLASTVLYDHLADRWLLAHTSYQDVRGPGQNPDAISERECIAVSKSPDPVGGGWNFYDFELTRSSDSIVDYPRIAMSPAGYYMTGVVFKRERLEGSRIWLFERSALLQGHRGRLASVSTGDVVLIPASVNGTLAPTDVLGFVLRMVKKQDGSGRDRLEILGLHNDWSSGGRTSIGPVASFDVEPFEALDCNCIPQPGTSIQLEGLGDRLMSPVEYRNFGSYETLLATHSVKMTHGSGSTAGMRWYEFRRPAGGQWSIFQQGTVESGDVNRWMGSIAMDGAGNIALGYSVASKTIYPGIRYSARLFTDPGGQMPRGETILFNGLGSQVSTTRWGGYTSMTADPMAPCLFWYTAEYLPASGDFNWHTRIANIRLTGCDARMAK